MPAHTYDAIAIDGPAASGKSTVARELAALLGLIMVNSGEMYRAITLEVLRRGLDPAERETVAAMLKGLDLRCAVKDGTTLVLLDGDYPGAALRSDAVNNAVSQIAAIPEVRELLVARQRDLLEVGDLVMEGRDIGSVVFPDTPYKIYIEACEEVRSQRRAAEGQVDEVASRDRQDAQRQTSPLIVPEGAAVIDTSTMGIAEVVEAAVGVLKERGWFERKAQSTSS